MVPLIDRFPLLESVLSPVRFTSFNPKTGEVRKIIDRHNLILFGGADLLARLLSGDSAVAIRTMYLEFKNLADPGDAIVPPAFDRSANLSYYSGLVSSPDTDFLRVPLAASPALSSSDDNLYNGNQATFFAMSEGSLGFHGKAFSSAATSAVYGAALVASPDINDQSQDIVFARVYSGIDKILKDSGFEIGVTWVTRFL